MSKLTIGNKMLLSVGALILTNLVLGAVAHSGIGSVGEHLHDALESGVKKDLLTYGLNTGSADLLSTVRGEMVRGEMRDHSSVEAFHKQFGATAEGFKTDLTTLDIMVRKPEAKQAIAEIRQSGSLFSDAEASLYSAITADDMAKASAIYTDKVFPAAQSQRQSIAGLLKIQQDVVQADVKLADESSATSRTICIAVLVFCLVLGAGVVFVIRGMNRDLMEGVTELAGSIGQIAGAASQVASSSQNMAEGASEQAATIEETSSASAEINSMAQRNTENSRSTAEIVTGAQVRTEQTNSSLTEMVEAMDGINSSSQKISKIIKVIDEIAFQTNILALNAAVEAARAGDAGMGFAVVADEVRNLAQRSAQAAKDTATLIEESIQRSNSGKVKVDQVAGGIHTVTAETAKIKVLVDEINLGSVEQSRGIDQISRSITEMEQVTQSNAASAQESAAAAAELSSQAQGMRSVVERLSEMVGSSSGSFAASAPVRQAAHGTPRKRVTIPSRPAARSSSNGSSSRTSMATMGSNFPMDDDFKEF